MIKAMTETEKKELDFFNRHARKMIPALVYRSVDKTNSAEIHEWNSRLILLGAVDSLQTIAIAQDAKEKIGAVERAKERLKAIKTVNIGLVATLSDYGPGVSLR